MSIGIRILLASLMFCSCLSTAPITRDTVEGELEQGMPIGWELGGRAAQDYVVLVDRKILHGGDASATMISLDAERHGQGQFRQPIRADSYAGRRVRFRAFVRTNQVDDWCALWMRADSETHQGIAFDDMASRRIEGTAGWKEYEVVLDIPEETTVLTFGAILAGIGQMWIDDCVLEIVGDDVATTGDYYARSKPNRRQVQADLNAEPVNLDFEGEVAEYLYGSGFE